MANHKSAIKRIRSSARRRIRNKVYMSRTRTEIKKAQQELANPSDLDAAIEQTRAAVSQIDKAVSKGILHKNNGARKKSNLMKKLAALEAQKS